LSFFEIQVPIKCTVFVFLGKLFTIKSQRNALSFLAHSFFPSSYISNFNIIIQFLLESSLSLNYFFVGFKKYYFLWQARLVFKSILSPSKNSIFSCLLHEYFFINRQAFLFFKRFENICFFLIHNIFSYYRRIFLLFKE